jgi:hypothetical protein
VPNGPAPFRVYSHWLPDNSMSQLVDVLDDASPRGTQTAPATSDDEVQRAVSALGINADPNVRQLEPDWRLAEPPRGLSKSGVSRDDESELTQAKKPAVGITPEVHSPRE